MKLKLYFPTKPYQVNQAWGILNPIYFSLGFGKHNGVDYPLAPDQELRWPQDYRVVKKDFQPQGAGHYVIGISTKKWEIGGLECYDEITFMHLKEPAPWDVGVVANLGEIVGIPDNTGLSTGPHTHERHRRCKSQNYLNDKNHLVDLADYNDPKGANGSYNHAPYLTGQFAEDIALPPPPLKASDQVALLAAKFEAEGKTIASKQLYAVAALLRVFGA